MKRTGYILIIITLLITVFLWFLSKQSPVEIFRQPLVSINQITALMGTVLFVWSMFLSTRLDFLENLFGGLDKVYKVHGRVSKIGAVLILLHPLALSLSSLQVNIKYFIPVHKLTSINLGVYSFWIFTATIMVTLLIKKVNLPYHLWKQIHRFINLAMLFALLHIVTVQSDTSFFVPLGVWIYALTGLGVASGLYKTFFYRSFGPKFEYKVVKIQNYNGVYDIYLQPYSQKLNHKISQYAYVSFINKNLPKESHPFCITSLPEDDLLRFSIKELGDYTKKLGNLKVDDKAIVWGPYGCLGEKFGENKDRILIGGGIGIAPFISMFKMSSYEKGNNITSLFYCTKYKNEAVFADEFWEIADSSKNLFYYSQCSRELGGCHLSAKQVKNRVRNINQTNVYLCGSSKMMLKLREDLIEEDFLKENITLEDFKMI